MPFTGVGTHLKKLKEKPDEAKRMVKALLRANRYVRSNREGTIQTMMDWIKVDRESAAATYDSTWKIFSEDGGMSESGLKLVIDQSREAMKIERAVALTEVADFGVIREVQKELGIKEIELGDGVMEWRSDGLNQYSNTPSLQIWGLL